MITYYSFVFLFPNKSCVKVSRLETQVTRFRLAAETSEKAEDDLKAEKRKLQREVYSIQIISKDICPSDLIHSEIIHIGCSVL